MEVTRETRHEQALDKHQRETKIQIWLPAAVALAVLAVLLIIVMAISTRTELSVTADLMLMVFVLCPLALCAFPFAIGFVALAALMNRVHNWTDLKLAFLMRFSSDVNGRIDRAMDRLGRAGINFGVRMAPIEKKLLNAFDRPDTAIIPEARHEPVSTRRNFNPPEEGPGT